MTLSRTSIHALGTHPPAAGRAPELGIAVRPRRFAPDASERVRFRFREDRGAVRFVLGVDGRIDDRLEVPDGIGQR
jgi:hypothetical protein